MTIHLTDETDLPIIFRYDNVVTFRHGRTDLRPIRTSNRHNRFNPTVQVALQGMQTVEDDAIVFDVDATRLMVDTHKSMYI